MSEQKTKIGYTIILAGNTGSGKTPITKRLLENSEFNNRMIFQPNRDYDEKSFTVFADFAAFKTFLNGAIENQIELKNIFMVVEDATGFIDAGKDTEWTRFLIAIEHNNNVFIPQFHSVQDIPPYFLRYGHFLIWLKTNDDEKTVRNKNSKLLPFFPLKTDRFINLREL